MSTVTVSTFTIPDWQYGGSTAKLRLYSNVDWIDSAGTPHLHGSPGDPTGFYQEIDLTVSDTTVTVPTFTTPSTADALDPQSASGILITGVLFDSTGAEREFLFSGFQIQTTTPITFSALKIRNRARTLPQAPARYLDAPGVEALIDSALNVGNPATTSTIGRVKASATPTDAASPTAIVEGDARAGKSSANYASLSAAVTAIGSTPTDLYVVNAFASGASCTVPSTLTLKFAQGGSVVLGSGHTVTVNSSPSGWPLAQILSGSGTLRFGPGVADEVFSVWWGYKADYKTIGSGATTASDATLTTASVFTSADVGKVIHVKNAGTPVALTGGINSGSDLLTITTSTFLPSDTGRIVTVAGSGLAAGTTILRFESPTVVQLSGNAASTVSGAAVSMAQDHVTTVASYTSATEVEMTAVAPTSVSGQTVTFGTDNAAAINAAFASVNRNLSDYGYAAAGIWATARVRIPGGVGLIGSNVVCGTSGSRTTGAILEGVSKNGTELRYVGSSSTAAVTMLNTHHAEVSRLAIVGTTPPLVCLWWASENGQGPSMPRTSDVYLSTAKFPLVIGGGTTSQVENASAYPATTGQFNAGLHTNLSIDNGVETIRIIGANTEVQRFIGPQVNTTGSRVCHGFNARGIVFDGGEVVVNSHNTNCAFLCEFEGASITHGGAFRINFDRVEGMMSAAYMHGGAGVGAPTPVQLIMDGLHSGSYPDDNGATPAGPHPIVDFRLSGTVTAINCQFVAKKSRFEFRELTGFSNVELKVINTRINNTDASATDLSPLVFASIATGQENINRGVRASFENVQLIDLAVSNFVSEVTVENQELYFSRTDISAGTYRKVFRRTKTAVKIDGALVTPAVSPAQITANQNNYSVALPSNVIRLSTDASRNITGLTFATYAQEDGQQHYLWNVGAQDLVLVNESASSTAANRFTTSTGADLTVAAKKVALLVYDGTTSRWRAVLLP